MKKYPLLITLAILAIIGGLFVSNKNSTTTKLTPQLTTSNASQNGITINARGTNNKEKIALYINNTPVTFWNLSNNFQDYTYTPNTQVTINELSVHFLNDTWLPEQNINYDVQIPHITVNGERYNSQHNSTVSTGSWDQDSWCAPGNKQTQWLHCNGSFTYDVPQGTVVGLPSQDLLTVQVGDEGITELTSSSVRITFTASEFVQAYIEYGTTIEYGQRTLGEESFDYETHIQRLTGLQAGTTYYFRINVIDQVGQTAQTTGSFTTSEGAVDPDPVSGWPSGTNDNLPMSGIFYGTSHGGLQTGNTRIAIEHSFRFRAEKTGQIQSLRWENRRLTQGNVDTRVGSVYDTCRRNNLSPEVCAFMLGNPYSVGNGGRILAIIHPDDGNGRPNESITLGAVDREYIPGNHPHGVWITQNMSAPVSVVAGRIYHVKLRNLAPPVGSFTGNTLAQARAHDPNTGAMGLNGMWQGVLEGPDSLKWGPYYGRMGQEALYRQSTSGQWLETPVTFGWLQFRYTDNVWTGFTSTGYDNIQTARPYSTRAYEGSKIVQGSTRVRQVFTVQDTDRFIDGMWLNFGHTGDATISSLVVQLKSASGTVLASGSIAGNRSIRDRVNAATIDANSNNSNGNLNELNVRRWGYTDLPETRLQVGNTYYLELSAPSNAGFHINSIFDVQSGRNSWTDAYAQVQRSSGASWEPYSSANGNSDRDLPLMFTLRGMPKQLP